MRRAGVTRPRRRLQYAKVASIAASVVMSSDTDSIPDSPRGAVARAELAAIVATGALHVASELWLGESTALGLSATATGFWAGYLLWRLARSAGIAREWGMRRDNFRTAWRAQLAFLVPGAAALIVLAAVLGQLAFPPTFWLTLALYPLWGTAQQFALQNLIAANVATMLRRPVMVALIAASLFAASHYPRMDLLVLTFAAGVPLTLIYRRNPNLWAVGLAHGILGSLAVYLVAGEDPGALILEMVR